MESPGSDDERLRQEADAGPEAMLSKKMKLLIIMLSLVLIILLVPLANNHGLPLLRPMGMSVLQRLWDAMRFIAMTAAISIGIISTSNSQKDNKGFDGSSHHRPSSSTRRPSSPAIAGRSSRESINPPKINGITGGDLHHRGIKGNLAVDLQKLKGKEVMNDLPFAASTSDTSINGTREGEIYGLERQSARSQQGRDWEEFTQRPARTLSADHLWFFAQRIDEEIEEEEGYISASAGHGFSSGRSDTGESNSIRAELQKKASDEKEGLGKKEMKVSADRGSMNVYTTSNMSDQYTDLRMRKATISRFADENGKDHRRSSSVDRRRPKYDYDKQSPNQPGLKQILMDLSKEKAANAKLSNLSSSSQAYNNAIQRPSTPSRDRSIHDTADIVSAPSFPKSAKANVQHQQSSVASTANSPSESNASITKSQILQNQADVIKTHLKGQSANLIRQTQPTTKVGSNQILQADKYAKMGSSQTVQKQVNAKVSTVQIVQKQTDNPAKMGNSNQSLQKPADVARMGSGQMLEGQPRHGDAKVGSSFVSDSVAQTQRRHNDEKGSKAINNLLRQSSKHSRSALNLDQLEQQLGDSPSSAGSTRPSAASRSSARRKKSFSYDFGDGFSPDWLMELEPPPPPGFFDEPTTMISTSPTQAPDYISKPPNPGSKNICPPTTVQSLVPWRSSNPIDISANYPGVTSPLSPPDASPSHSTTGPSPGEVNRRAEAFISYFNTRLIRQRQESLERQRKHG
eukprot:c18373_g1_i1 orf=698-2929(+)